MSEPLFPRTAVSGVSLSRIIIGTNWLLGWSHTGAAADAVIRGVNCNREAVASVLEAFLARGVDTVMGPLSREKLILDAMKLAEDRTGKALIRVDTPVVDVSDNAASRKDTEEIIAGCAKEGAKFCLLHHSSAEQLVNKNTQTLDRLPDYLKMVRDHGMIPGLSAHMPELIVYSDANEYDVQTYIQIYNCMGFMMQIEIESVHNIIWNAKKPVMTIKPMAAGRCTPFVGFNFVWNTIRPCDMVTVGCLTPREAEEDVEFSLAALERRPPELEGRSSPNKTGIMK
jgi:hypothetical protein